MMGPRTFAVLVTALAACGETPPGRTYYERNIEPILLQKCAGNTSGCHSINADDPFAIAAGNLDVTSFENLQKRRDVLAPFGAYPHPLLLIKAVGDGQLKMQYGTNTDGTPRFLDIDVQHSGGGILDVGSDAYFTLQTWLENGATINGLKPDTPARTDMMPCSTTVPPGFDPAPYTSHAQFGAFRQNVQPIFSSKGCGAGSCHGAPQSDFYITCGDDETQLAFNFSQAWAFVNEPVEDSQLLRIPLAVSAGGRGHTGGDQFSSTDAARDPQYDAVRTWATAVGKRDFAAGDPAKQFFADHVQPVLLERGCAFQACHSPQAGNDFKLRSGAVGFFSAVALEKNYDLLRHDFMALEFADARRGRAVAKAILDDDPRVTSVGGIVHRGGPVLETPNGGPAEPASCAPTFDPATASAFCVLQRWVDLERQQLLAAGEVTPMGQGDPISIVYVQRPAGTAVAGRLDFANFQGGAELMRATTSFGANQVIQPADASAATAIHTGCGLGASPDIQAPDVANDGTRVAFAARATASDPLGVYVVNLDGTGCARITPASDGHNFDPAWSPDGTHLVFSSTRADPNKRTRKRNLPAADLWRIPMNGLAASGAPERMTFLSDSEIGAAFMREGRVTMTTEKVGSGVFVPGQMPPAGGFYQLAGRRINWDLTDYHPLLAQRKDSVYGDPANLAATRPSIGYGAATDIREGANGDFLMILSDVDPATGAPAVPNGAGALGVFNRSVGPFEQGRVQDGYLQALRIIDEAGASGRAGAVGGYRHPVSLPDGTIMAAYASNVGQGNFDIVAVDPRTQQRRDLMTGGTGVRVDAVLAYKYPARKLYANRRQLVFGGASDTGDAASAVLHMPDAPMVFTLLSANLRRGRPVDAFRSARRLVVKDPNGQSLGSTELREDGSLKVRVPAGRPIVMELVDANGNLVVSMVEEHQLGPGERISMGIQQQLFDAVCGGCHGSISGRELDVIVTPDALTGASQSASATAQPASLE